MQSDTKTRENSTCRGNKKNDILPRGVRCDAQNMYKSAEITGQITHTPSLLGDGDTNTSHVFEGKLTYTLPPPDAMRIYMVAQTAKKVNHVTYKSTKEDAWAAGGHQDKATNTA